MNTDDARAVLLLVNSTLLILAVVRNARLTRRLHRAEQDRDEAANLGASRFGSAYRAGLEDGRADGYARGHQTALAQVQAALRPTAGGEVVPFPTDRSAPRGDGRRGAGPTPEGGAGA